MDPDIPKDESTDAFRGRLSLVIAAMCAEGFVAHPSYMGCRTCDYTDLCEAAGTEK